MTEILKKIQELTDLLEMEVIERNDFFQNGSKTHWQNTSLGIEHIRKTQILQDLLDTLENFPR